LKNRIETPNLGCAVLGDGRSRLVLSDNYILGGASGLGGTVEVDYSSAMIQRNVISSTGTVSGINGYRSTGGLISNNKIYVGRGESAGVQLDHSDSIAISNNLFIRKGNDGIGILLIESNDITVLNNTLDTALRGIQALNSRTTVLNNIVTGNIGYGISLSMTSSASHNDLWGNALDYYNTSPGQGDLNLDPRFIDPSREQYALRADSPCRDQGDPAPGYYDLDGSRNDIGLYGGPGLDT
jgi:parallel beta-helix repeat protein